MDFLSKYLQSTAEKEQNKAVIAYLASLDYISTDSPKIAESILQELKDQRSNLKMIASENYSSLAVQLAMGNLLTDKYAEGFANHRFYAGCSNIDAIEEEAMSQVKKLFGAEFAYVQPHSGADANLIAFLAILIEKVQSPELERLGAKKVDELSHEDYETLRKVLMNQSLLGMGLNSGGHLTHGYRHNLSSKLMRAFSYEVDPKTQLLDYENIEKLALEIKPLILLAGYSAYPRAINFARMKEIAVKAGSVFMVDMAHFAGLVAGKVFEGDFNPIPYADIVTSTTHKTLRGPRGGLILAKKEFGHILNKGCPLAMGGPLPHVMAAKAIAFQEANKPSFHSYAQKIVKNAQALAEELVRLGLRITTGGTDNHLLVVDVTPFGITGRQAEGALRAANITLNRNTIPSDPNGPWYTSGVRLGTPALTTLGMGPAEMKIIAKLIHAILKSTKAKEDRAQFVTEEKTLLHVNKQVEELLLTFPLYPEIRI
ncbi:MAG: glycine hydroxymethyltransferase [Chlamydiae bacterium]|nr:glycine hydroxymethyltransferase [Chlamydiota bacterium]